MTTSRSPTDASSATGAGGYGTSDASRQAGRNPGAGSQGSPIGAADTRRPGQQADPSMPGADASLGAGAGMSSGAGADTGMSADPAMDDAGDSSR